MHGFAVLDLGIGLALVYLLLALICMALMEWVSQARRRRGSTLLDSLPRLLGEDRGTERPVTTALLQHPLIRTLGEKDRPPSYISSHVFAAALCDVVEKQPSRSTHVADILHAVAPGNGERWDRNAVAAWFDHYMDRVSGGFTRNTRKWVLAISIGLTLALNADSLTLMKTLWTNPTLRTYLVERAKTRLEQGPPLQTVEYADPLSARVSRPDSTMSDKSPDRLLAAESDLIGSLFGWENESAAVARFEASYGGGLRGRAVWFVVRLMGWAITVLAVSLGAPFWFDTLNKLTNIRSAGVVPKKVPEVSNG